MSIDSFVAGVVMTAGAAAAATGGMVAGEGQTIVTGDSSASVQVTSIVHAGDHEGTSHTEIIKTVDGNTTSEVVDKTYAPGEPIKVETVVEAVSGETYAHSSSTAHAETEIAVDEEISTSSTKIAEHAKNVLEFFSQLFHSVFGIFSR
ncbi:MAG: hypothetical protein KBD50_00570 [Candidatus Pacebacteria bacterium]|nr:hypothetical protein [Candidatus Paceibacterota bacterium]